MTNTIPSLMMVIPILQKRPLRIGRRKPPSKGKTPSNGKVSSSKKRSSNPPLRAKAMGLVSKKTRNIKTRDDDDGVEFLFKKLINQKLKTAEEDDLSKAVRLAEQFKQMYVALDSKIKAAYARKEFVQFLDSDEKFELEGYKERNQ